MKALIAKILSGITEPPIIMSAAVLILVFNQRFFELGYAMIFLFIGGFLPFTLFIADYLYNKKDQFNPDRKHRQNIFLLGAFSYGFLILYFGSSLVNSTFWAGLSMLISLLLFLMYVVDVYFDKCSVHSAIFSFWIIFLGGQISNGWFLGLLLLPFIIWSRVYLKQHTWAQIMWGLSIGILLGIFSWGLIR